MGLGSFLADAGSASAGSDAGLQSGFGYLNAIKAQQDANAMDEAVDAAQAQNATLAAGATPSAGVQQGGQYTPTKAVAPPPTPSTAAGTSPMQPAAPQTQGTQAGVQTQGTQAAGTQPTQTVAGINISSIANPQVQTYQPNQPAAPANVLTPAQATSAGQWLQSGDARAFFTAHPDQYTALQANPAKWVQDVFLPGKMPGLYGSPDPLKTAAQINQTQPQSNTEYVLSALSPGTIASPNANRDLATKVKDTQIALSRNLGTVSGHLTSDAHNAVVQAQAQTVKGPPQTPYDPTVAPVAGSPAPVSAGAAQQMAQNKPPTDWYLANPQAIGSDVQNAIQTRQFLADRARIFARVHTPQALQITDQLIGQMKQADEQIASLQGMQGIMEMSVYNDPRRLAGYLSYKTGTPTDFIPHTDGTWDMVATGADGKQHVVAQNKSTQELTESAHRLLDAQYNASRTAAEAEAAAKTTEFNRDIFKTGLENQSKENIAREQNMTTLYNNMITIAGAQGSDRLKADLARNAWTSPDGTTIMNVGGQMIMAKNGTIMGRNGQPIPNDQFVDIMRKAGYTLQGGPGSPAPATFP